jgi:hypothetical protein
MADKYFGMHNCLDRGLNFESLARSILERAGYETQKSTMEDDIFQHVDFWAVGKDGKSYGFDAKAMKSLTRGAPPQDEWAFVEWRGVSGFPGWLLKGCDILVFEREKDILLIRRSDLLDFCKRKTDDRRIVRNSCDAKYCMYSRQGRKDKISLFKFSDLDVPFRVFIK